MKKIASALLIMFFGAVISTASAAAISSAELINNARKYDASTVNYEGEVIGEVMLRGDYAWVNINDGLNAIGVWMPRELTRNIRYAGSYRAKGDWVSVTGVFNRACPQHGGDLDIHAKELTVISVGRETKERLNLAKGNLALVLFGILCLVLILRLLKKS